MNAREVGRSLGSPIRYLRTARDNCIGFVVIVFLTIGYMLGFEHGDGE